MPPYYWSGNCRGGRAVSDRLDRLTGEHDRLLAFQRSPRTIDQGCSSAGYLMEHLPGRPPCLGSRESDCRRAAMLEAEITQAWMFIRTAFEGPVVLAITTVQKVPFLPVCLVCGILQK